MTNYQAMQLEIFQHMDETSRYHWPLLEEIGLRPSQLDARMLGIGGSDANVIFGGDEARLTQLWREKRGEVPSADLSHILPVMMGQWTEAFNRQWYQQQTGYAVDDVGLVAICSNHSWRRATLDGFVEAKSSVWEAKHVSAFTKTEEVLTRYMPQLQHNMAVIGAENAILSVIMGNHKWETFEVSADWLYQDQLFEAERVFWDCVRFGKSPVPLPPPAPPKPTGAREVNLEGNNAWAAAAADWIANREPARIHAAAVKGLKELVEDDVTRATGHGIEARRSKSGAISIRELI